MRLDRGDGLDRGRDGARRSGGARQQPRGRGRGRWIAAQAPRRLWGRERMLARPRQQRRQERASVLGGEHADDEVERPALQQPGRLSASTCAGGRIVAAVEPEPSIRRAQLGRAAPPPAAAAVPASAPPQAAARSPRSVEPGFGELQGRRDGEAGIADLMRPGQGRPRQVEPPPPPLHGSPSRAGAHAPIAASSSSGAPTSAARASISASASGGCGRRRRARRASGFRPSRARSAPACRQDSSGGRATPG